MKKNEKIILGVVALAAVGAYFYFNRKNGSGEAKSGVSGAMVNPCKAKLGQPCGENQGGDWVSGTWQSGGYGRGCVCKKGATSISAPSIGTLSTSDYAVKTVKRGIRTGFPMRGGVGYGGAASAKKLCKSIHHGDLVPCGRWDATKEVA